MKRSNLTIALYMFLVFASGMLVGVFGFRLYTTTPVAAKTSPTVSPADSRKQYIGEMQSRLKLTPEQLQKLNTVMDETRAHYHQAHEVHDTALKQIKQHHIETVRAMLSPEQRAEYEKLLAERERRAKAAGKN